jgi:3-hydroxyacyl-CoA dehydrogenase
MSAVLPDLPATLKKLRDEDARGTVNGRGFYQYNPGDDQIWDRRAREHAWTTVRKS